MGHKDPKARKEMRYRVNLNYYQAAAIEALAVLQREQPSTYLRNIIAAHLDSMKVETSEERVNRCA